MKYVSGLIFDPIKMKCFLQKKIMVHFLIIKELEYQKKKLEECLFATNEKKLKEY